MFELGGSGERGFELLAWLLGWLKEVYIYIRLV
jgi:hypothetical protein